MSDEKIEVGEEIPVEATPEEQKKKHDMDERFRLRDEAIGLFRDTVMKWEADPTASEKIDPAKVQRAKELHAALKEADPTYEVVKGVVDDQLDPGSEVVNPGKQP